MPKIYIMNGPEKGRSFEVDEEAIFVGRAPITRFTSMTNPFPGSI